MWRATIRLLTSRLDDLIAERTTWDDVFLSLRMRFEESTDRFVVHLGALHGIGWRGEHSEAGGVLQRQMSQQRRVHPIPLADDVEPVEIENL